MMLHAGASCCVHTRSGLPHHHIHFSFSRRYVFGFSWLGFCVSLCVGGGRYQIALFFIRMFLNKGSGIGIDASRGTNESLRLDDLFYPILVARKM